MVNVEASDVGVRRTDSEVVGGVEHFAVVADTGTGEAFVRVQCDWRSPTALLDFAQRITDAALWIQEN